MGRNTCYSEIPSDSITPVPKCRWRLQPEFARFTEPVLVLGGPTPTSDRAGSRLRYPRRIVEWQLDDLVGRVPGLRRPREQATSLALGLTGTKHKLELIARGPNPPMIRAIRVYRPPVASLEKVN